MGILFGSPQALDILAKDKILNNHVDNEYYPLLVAIIACLGRGKGVLIDALLKTQGQVELAEERERFAEEEGDTKEADKQARAYCSAVNKREATQKRIYKLLSEESAEALKEFLGDYRFNDLQEAIKEYNTIFVRNRWGY